MKTIFALITVFVSMTALAGTGDVDSSQGIQSSFKSLYTDLDKDCVVISSANDNAPIDFYEMECKSFGGYRLTVGGGDLRYSPRLSFGGKKIEWNNPMGFYDTASKKIEWVFKQSMDKEGSGTLEWKGLIYRLEHDGGDGTPARQLLYVIRLDGEKSCLVGTTQSNVKAREMAYNSKPGCK